MSNQESLSFPQQLDKCRNYGDIFDVVKKAVKTALAIQRSGLMLYVSDLTPQVGAYHGIGSNTIVLNGALIRLAEKETKDKRKVNSLIFYLLLHEYLHSLGFIDESLTRNAAYQVSLATFGSDDTVTKIARNPLEIFTSLPQLDRDMPLEGPMLIKDFDRPERTYIV